MTVGSHGRPAIAERRLADRWSVWPVVVSVVGLAGLVLLCDLPEAIGFCAILLLPLICLVAAVALIARAIRAAVQRRTRATLSVLIALVAPLVLWSPVRLAADYAHLALTVGWGVGQNGGAFQARDEAFAVYDWSTGLAGGPSTLLIHDASDEVARPAATPRSRADFADMRAACAGRVRRLWPHYYICVLEVGGGGIGAARPASTALRASTRRRSARNR